MLRGLFACMQRRNADLMKKLLQAGQKVVNLTEDVKFADMLQRLIATGDIRRIQATMLAKPKNGRSQKSILDAFTNAAKGQCLNPTTYLAYVSSHCS